MAEKYEYNFFIDPPRSHDKVANEKIVKLGKKITDVLDHKIKGITVEDPEYYGLAEIVTDEMADLALEMELRHHYTFEDLKKLDKGTHTEEDLQKLVDEMCYIGLLEYDYGYHYDHNGRTAPQSERRYSLVMFVPGSAELFNMDEKADGSNPRLMEHPAVGDFFERMTYIPLAGITHMIPEGGAGVGMHVIPVEKAISMENEAIDIEKLSYWLKKYEGKIGVGRCSCRASRAAIGEVCADDDFSWCIGVGDFADYCRETGKGHDITYEEAMDILRRAEEKGFVHQVTNIDGDNKIFGICNCNVQICNALRTSQYFNTPNMSASAYRAEVTTKDCVACGKCVEYCPAGAVRLGQKLCTTKGEVVYPRRTLPEQSSLHEYLNWKDEKWSPEYRNENRINCYDTGTAPCKTACPAHVAVQGYLKMAAQGRYQDALALIKKDNPFPAICGRVCNHKCEDACTRGTIDRAVSIDAVKKFIAEQDLKAESRYVPPVQIASNRYKNWKQKIAIIGAGPAGLSCAYYLATNGYKPTIFEKSEKPGGMMRYGIPSYKLEKDVIDAEIEVIKELGVEIKCGVEVGKDITLAELRAEGYDAFYIAIGCQGGRLANIPGEDAEGIDIAVSFLHKATEDQSQKMEGDVVVIGGGNVAVDCARTAHRFGANKVSMVCLETRETMPASNEEVAETLEEDIAICNSWGPKEILKDENGKVKAVVFKKCTATHNAEGKFAPQYDENDTMTIECSNVVYAIGQAIEWGKLLEGEKVEFWHGNYPVADGLTFQTAQPDIFVGGDVYTGPSFVINAIEEGKCAAESLHRYVQWNDNVYVNAVPATEEQRTASMKFSLQNGRNRRDFIELDKNNLVIDNYDNSSRQEAGMDESVDHKMSFRDAHKTLTEEQVKIETARCLGCGASVVDPNRCIGCGVCTTKCEFDAIHLVRSHPHASDMVIAEDKFKYILPNFAKNVAKLAVKKIPKEVKEYEKKYVEFRESMGLDTGKH
ncbi:MAG: FAD-dependent oxidoreductase [Clostridia bacterium]|nr:FAD-dependent oxidoreductase [Clostridia bacterium]